VHDTLVDRLRAGNATALREIYEQYYRPLWELAYTLTSKDVAEDIVHDVFMAIWHRRTTLVVRDGMRAYLYGAVRHRALNVLRHERLVERRNRAVDPEVGTIPGMGNGVETPAQHTEATALQEALRVAVEALPLGQRDAIMLHWRHGLSNAEIAAVMGTTTNATTVQIARARAALRKSLAAWLT